MNCILYQFDLNLKTNKPTSMVSTAKKCFLRQKNVFLYVFYNRQILLFSMLEIF